MCSQKYNEIQEHDQDLIPSLYESQGTASQRALRATTSALFNLWIHVTSKYFKSHTVLQICPEVQKKICQRNSSKRMSTDLHIVCFYKLGPSISEICVTSQLKISLDRIRFQYLYQERNTPEKCKSTKVFFQLLFPICFSRCSPTVRVKSKNRTYCQWLQHKA